MAPLQLPGKMTTVCFGEACAGIWARSPPKGSPKHGGDDDQLALETLAVFLILWLIFTLVAVLREMSLRRYLYAQLSGLANSQPAEEKAPAMRNILRQFEKLNEQFPVETASAEAAAEACTVCLDLIGESCPVRKLDCGHVFHISCIDRWVLQSLGSQAPNAAPACPVCKAPILRVGCDAGVEADDGVDSESADELTYITDDVEVNLV